MPFGQVGIGGGTLLADIVPRFLKSLQNIGILYSGRFRIVKCGKTNRENIFLVREFQFTGIIQTLFQYIFSSGTTSSLAISNLENTNGGTYVLFLIESGLNSKTPLLVPNSKSPHEV